MRKPEVSGCPKIWGGYLETGRRGPSLSGHNFKELTRLSSQNWNSTLNLILCVFIKFFWLLISLFEKDQALEFISYFFRIYFAMRYGFHF